MTNDVVLILTTVADDSDPEALARTLVEERLAACVNVSAPMRSLYRWQDAVHSEGERQLVIKTVRGRIRDVEARLRALHAYELPEFLVVSIEQGSEAYVRWVTESATGV